MIFHRPGGKRFSSVLAVLGSTVFLGACSSGGESPSQASSAVSSQEASQVAAATNPSPDPQIASQWHLGATADSFAYDLAIGKQSERGRGITLALIDGTVDAKHPDLQGQLLAGSQVCCDWAAVTSPAGSSDPSAPAMGLGPMSDLGHATGLAALIAANESNGIGGRGIAPASRLLSLNAIAIGNDSRLVQAMKVAIGSGAAVINNSWSPPDPGQGGSRSFYQAPAGWYEALDEAQTLGRGGLGAIVVKAVGNGGASLSPSRLAGDSGDQANYDGFAQHPLIISVAAVDAAARPLASSEPGAQVLVSAFSSQTNTPVVSTGTEALPEGSSTAAAMVSAVSALMLEAQPRLSWRDLRWILASTARPIPGYDQAGVSSAVSSLREHGFHQKIGFGLIDAGAAILMAKSFAGLPAAKRCNYDAQQTPPMASSSGLNPGEALSWQQLSIEERSGTVSFSFDLPLGTCPVERIESLLLSIATSHQDASGLRLTLVSPAGRGVQFTAPRDCNQPPCTNLSRGFQFHTVRFMAEAAYGSWTLQIREESGKSVGQLSELRLNVIGH